MIERGGVRRGQIGRNIGVEFAKNGVGGEVELNRCEEEKKSLKVREKSGRAILCLLLVGL